jgi:hypothetical protein
MMNIKEAPFQMVMVLLSFRLASRLRLTFDKTKLLTTYPLVFQTKKQIL